MVIRESSFKIYIFIDTHFKGPQKACNTFCIIPYTIFLPYIIYLSNNHSINLKPVEDLGNDFLCRTIYYNNSV